MAKGGGYFLVYRSVTDEQHALHPKRRGEPACALGAWVDLLGLARWKDSGGVKRGEVAMSVRQLATRWNWKRDYTHRFLRELEAAGAIERVGHERGRFSGRSVGQIRICNYDDYQKSSDVLSDDFSDTKGATSSNKDERTTTRARARGNGRQETITPVRQPRCRGPCNMERSDIDPATGLCSECELEVTNA